MTIPPQQETLRFGGRRIIAVVAIVSLIVLIGVAAGRTSRARMQSANVTSRKDALVEQIEKSPDVPLAIQQDEDTPLRILEAKAKEVSAADYEKLTSSKSDHPLIVSAPEVRMLNVSNKIINRVMLLVSDPSVEKSTGLMRHNLSLSPGVAYTILPADFVKPDYLNAVEENGKATSSVKDPMKSKSFWLPFADKSKLRVRVAVEFQDGTKWFNREQRGGGQ